MEQSHRVDLASYPGSRGRGKGEPGINCVCMPIIMASHATGAQSYLRHLCIYMPHVTSSLFAQRRRHVPWRVRARVYRVLRTGLAMSSGCTCRLCCSVISSHQYVSLFTASSICNKWPARIQDILEVSVSTDDGLPQHICSVRSV